MKGSTAGVALVCLVALAFGVWASYGPFFVATEFHWSVTPLNQTMAFVAGLLWLPVLALTFRRDPGGRMWKLLLLQTIAGGTWVLGYIRTDLTFTLSEFFGPLGAVVLLHLVLAFPTGRLRDRVDRGLVGVAYAIVLPIQLIAFLFWDPGFVNCSPTDWCPHNVLLVARNDDVYGAIRNFGLLSPIVAVLSIGELLRHWRTSSPAGRRALTPMAVGMPFVFAILGVWWVAPALDRDDIRVFMLQNQIFNVPSFVTPILFLASFVRTRLARGAVADLAVELGRGIPIGGLQAAIARTLRDPTAQLGFPSGPDGELVDLDGHPFALPIGPGRSVARLEHDGELLAVLAHDRSIEREDPGLVDAVGAVARLALENERLAAQVRAQLEEVRASRLRIIEAGDTERRRVERDLHDGAQQRLVALAMRLELAQQSAGGASTVLAEAAEELRTAIAEVRDLARGLHPAILSEAGLAAAIESLVERLPIPVEVDASEGRYPEPVERAAYFVVAEALTNVARYSGATHASVVSRSDDGLLSVTVTDDGRGGADASRGSGLRSLSDRVGAIGGRFFVSSPPGGGTTITAELPV